MIVFGILTGPSVKIIEVVTQHFNQATVIGHTGFCAMDLRYCTIINNPSLGGLSCPPHKKMHLLWNRPESLFLRMVQDVRSIENGSLTGVNG